MIQLKIAVLDRDEEYLKQLDAYLIRRKERFFQVWTFTEIAAYEKTAGKETFDVLLITGELLTELEWKDRKEKMILFAEDEIPKIAEGMPSIYKYQSAEQIFLQISSFMWQEELPEDETLSGRRTEMIAVYSPVRLKNQMMFSVTMAQILGTGHKVLYLNLQECSGFYSMSHIDATEDIGDFIYGMMQKEQDFQTYMHRIRRTYLNFDYIPPTVNPEHISEISAQLFETLFFQLKNKSGYDVVIVDFGSIFAGFTEILSLFDYTYVLGCEGTLEQFRIKEFDSYLEKTGEKMQIKVKRLLLPEKLLDIEDYFLPEKNLYGAMGDYIRSLLGGEVIE